MPRTLSLVLFLFVIIGVTFGLHYYFWMRLAHDPMLPLWAKRLVTFALIALGVSLIAVFPIMRLLPRAAAAPFAWISYIWLGMVLFLSLALLGFDIVRWTTISKDASPERRLFLQRTFALGALGVGGLVSGISIAQALRKARIKKVAISLKKWPSGLNGFRMVQLTDLHIGPTLGKEWLQEIVSQTNQLQPDVVVITGDLVDGSVDKLKEHVAPLQQLQTKYGVFFVTGNHEYYSGADEWIAELARLGVRVLRNERVAIETPQGGFDLAGVDDFHSGTFPGHGPNLPKALEGRNTGKAVVLLAHQPAAIKEAEQLGVDLQLSGHTHGGQLWPWNYFVRLQQPYVTGLHTQGDTTIYISPGTGYWGPPMRLGSTAEITEVLLSAAPETSH